MDIGSVTGFLHGISAHRIWNWVQLAVDMSFSFSQLGQLLRKDGVYEILDYDSTLELMDERGKMAVFRRTQKVKFLQDNVIAYQDHAWGDGELFVEYSCSPGVAVDEFQDGDRWTVLISLRETKNKGDIVDFYISRIVRDGFTKDDEWRQTEIQFPTRRLRMSVIFPKERWCQRAVIQEKTRNRTLILGPAHFMHLPDGRQILTWEKKRPAQHETYTLKWQW